MFCAICRKQQTLEAWELAPTSPPSIVLWARICRDAQRGLPNAQMVVDIGVNIQAIAVAARAAGDVLADFGIAVAVAACRKFDRIRHRRAD